MSAQTTLALGAIPYGGDIAHTPAGVCDQHLAWGAEALLERAPRRVLCPAAGAGAWVEAVRRLWPDAEIVAVEIAEDAAALIKVEGVRVIVGDSFLVVPRLFDAGERFDLAVDNPPWSTLGGWAPLVRSGLNPGGVAAFYGPTQWGQSARDQEVLDEWSPVAVTLTGGRVNHHPRVVEGQKRGGDQRDTCVRWWTERPRGAGLPGWLRRSWTTYRLDSLDKRERSI